MKQPTLDELITNLIDSADDTGCTDDLTVVSREALTRLAQARSNTNMSNTKETLPRTVIASDLKLADTVKLFDDAYSYAMVEQITEDEVTFVRPYMVHGDFSHTGGVSTSIGLEKFKVPVKNPNYTYTLVRRGGPLK